MARSLVELIRDHRRRLETVETVREVRDLGHGFKLGSDGRVFLEDPIKGRISFEEAVAALTPIGPSKAT
jgi:hypothetical protein